MRTLYQVLTMEEPDDRHTLTSFERSTNEDGRVWATIEFDGMGLGVPLDGVPHDWTPPIGSEVIAWGDGLGRPVRGVAIDGVLLYYRTAEEQESQHRQQVEDSQREQIAEYELSGKAKLDADYDALPPVFQARIDKFRRNNPDFRWKYEGYEMFCCTEAMKLVAQWGTVTAAEHYASLATDETFSKNRAQWDAEWEEKKAIDRAAGLADGHSGNTHGAAVALAFWYLKNPENVEKMHGALAPLVGSAEYGCVARDKDAIDEGPAPDPADA